MKELGFTIPDQPGRLRRQAIGRERRRRGSRISWVCCWMRNTANKKPLNSASLALVGAKVKAITKDSAAEVRPTDGG